MIWSLLIFAIKKLNNYILKERRPDNDVIADDDFAKFSSSRCRINMNYKLEDNSDDSDAFSGKYSKIGSVGEDFDDAYLPCKDVRTMFKGVRVLYFKWLLDKLDKKMVKKYSSLLFHLYKDTFMENERVPRDVNRARDGVGLRTKFIGANGFGDSELENLKYDDCSWLEMLIGLSEKIDDQMMFDMNIGNRTNKWFWLIIEQMDLDKFDDKHYIYDNVKRKLNRFVRRDYENGGKNGIFKCRKDVREVEIWYQMMEFFIESIYMKLLEIL